MNKIYKVVWSKVKHCYVVTSELAKRNSKGCGARSLRMAAVSMGMAAALIGGISGSVAEAAEGGRVEEGGSGTFPAENGRYYSAENLYWNPSTKSVTVTASSIGSDGNSVSTKIDGKRYIIGNVVYQSSTTNVLVDAETAKFKFEGGTLKRYYTNPGMIAQKYQQHIEGYSDANKDVSGYSVTVDMGSSGSESKDKVYGGYSQFGKASDNSVTVKSGLLNWVYGGYSFSGAATGNSVTMTGGTVRENVNGGESYSGSADAEGNEVTISGGTVNAFVLGAFVYTSTGNAENNKVTVSGTTLVYKDVIGAEVGGGGNAIGNSVTIEGGTVKWSVGGGHAFGEAGNAGSAEGNAITMSGGSVSKSLYGGKSSGKNHDETKCCNSGAVTDNKVTMTGGSVATDVIGGESYSYSEASGDANNNTVTISAETGETTIGNSVIGGLSKSETGVTGNANSNVVTISGGMISGGVYGGKSFTVLTSGKAKNANNNEVTVSGGTINGGIYGGYGYSAATGNTVKIKDGTIGKSGSDVGFLVFGGDAKAGDSNQNNVIITGGTVHGDVVGGYAYFDAVGNTVTLSNCTINGSVYGSYTIDGETKNNTVNLTGKVSGLDGKYSVVSGGDYARTGNELHIGGTKDGSITGAWQGMTGDVVTNKISTVRDFESIVYHNVKWDDKVPALEVNTLYDVGAIDITKLEFTGSASSGTMSLLKATGEDADLSTIKLNYQGGQGKEITTDGVVISGGTPTTEKDGVNGVKLTSTSSNKVLLASDKKAINYSKGATIVSRITFGEFDKAKETRNLTGVSFAGTNTVDADGLSFKATSDALKMNDSITLLNNATGITTTVDNSTGKKIAINYAEQGIVFDALATGDVTSTGTAVNYTVGSVTVKNIDVSKWKGSPATVTESWDTKNAEVKTNGISVTGMNPGDAKPILTAASGSDFSNVTLDSGAWQEGGAITNKAENGVEIAGTTTGGGVKVSDDKSQLLYQQDKKNVTGITLGAFDASQAACSFGSGDDLRSATINAEGFSISNLDATKTSVVVVDATNAIKDESSGATLKKFEKQNVGDAVAFEDKIAETVLTFSGTHQDVLEQNDAQTQILYTVGNKNVSDVKFDGAVAWSDSAYYTNDKTKYKFVGATKVDADKLVVNGTTSTALKADGTSSMMLLSATGLQTGGDFTDQSAANKEASTVTVNYSDATSGIAYGAEAKGAVVVEPGAVKYNINEVKVKTVDLANWNGNPAYLASGDTSTWTAADKSVAVNNADAITVTPTKTQAILTAESGMFQDVNVAKTTVAFDPVTENGVTLTGTKTNSIQTTKTKVDNDTVSYVVGKKDVKSIAIGAIEWGGKALDGSSADYNYEAASVDSSKFDINNPDKVEANVAKILLKANDTLKDMTKDVNASYNDYEVTTGVLMNGMITGSLSKSGNNIVFTAAENKATDLTFGKVEWTGSNPLIDHKTTLKNVSFDGATVDTSNIDFYKEMYIEADQTMTLVSDFGGEANITPESTKYMVGTAYEGESETKLEGNNLILRTKTAAGLSEQTHKTVMAMEAGVALLAGGNEHIGKALESLGDVVNQGSDGISVGVSIGGSGNRYETGSHLNLNSWNAVLAIGAKRELKQGTLEYGIFGEYGKGSYKLHNDDGGTGDGDAHYAGGGLMAKWTNKHDVYAEASFRMGRMSDSTTNLLYDAMGNGYGYDVHANYFGAHVGVGKIFRYKGGKSLDVYGKYFYTKRDGVDFVAGGSSYSLDSVASSLLRIGARYGTTDKKWNWYGGLAYEYEFDGKSDGTVSAGGVSAAIRAASIKGSSVRGEIGMKMNATSTNPWQVDVSLYGYGGKHRGFGGNVNVAYMF